VKYLNLIRWKNVLIVIATMYLMRYCVIKPFLEYGDLPVMMSSFNFLLMVVSVAAAAIAGYSINDYFDLKADKINRPDEVLLGTSIPLKHALYINYVFNAIAIAVALWFAVRLGDWNYSFVFAFTTGILWFYSTSYKSIPILGNLIVASLVAMVPILVVAFEMILFSKTYHAELSSGTINYMPVMYFVTGFSVFAFMVTFLREMVKDMEDREGDKEVGKKTMAVVFGIATSKVIAQVLLWTTVFSIYYVAFKYLPGDWISLAYFTIFIVIPLLYVSWKLQKANLPNAFHLVQQILKIILVTGLLYAVLICVQLA